MPARPSRAAAATIAVFALALAVRLVALDRSPHFDEMFHVLTARALLEDGTLRVDGGAPYERARLHTYLVAGMFKLFGEGLVQARLPGALAGAGLVAAAFAWIRRRGGSAAAWAAALLLALHPTAVHLAQLGRFYAVHALLFWGAALAVYRLTEPGGVRSAAGAAALAAATAGALATAHHLHPNVLVGALALGLWVAAARGPGWARTVHRRSLGRWVWPAAALVLVAAAAFAVRSGTASGIWELYRYADVWAEGNRANVRYYHNRMLNLHPTLWTLAPVVFLLALRAHARAALFSAVVFGVPLLVHSLAAWKSERYLFYALPWFFVLSGLALGWALPRLRDAVARVLEERPFPGLPPAAARSAAVLLLVAAGGFAVLGNPAFSTTAKMLHNPSGDSEVHGWEPNWKDATPILEPVAAASSAVLASSPHKALYYLGRVDLSVHARELITRQERRPEFALWPWFVPRPVISTSGSLETVMACAPSGLVVVDSGHWASEWGLPGPAAALLEERAQRIPLPDRWGLHAFRWIEPLEGAPGSCALLDGVPTS